jgi:hypothetical protein
MPKVFMIDRKDFYTYVYLREDGTPYYVGKGTKTRAFVKQHGSVRPPMDTTRIHFLHNNVTENQALAFEIFWIAVYGRVDNGTGVLHNKTDGGDRGGQVPSVVTRKKMSESAKARPSNQIGRKRTLQQKENITNGVSESGKQQQLEGARLGGKWHAGKTKPKYLCPHCNRMIAANMLDRYHNDNCKSKI